MIKWEYKTEDLAAVQMENQLNFLGKEGWELVHVTHHPEAEFPYFCIFKRPISRF